MSRLARSLILIPLAAVLCCLPAAAEADGETPAGRLAVGQEAPDFTLSDPKDGEHTLSALRGETHAILVFFRGAW